MRMDSGFWSNDTITTLQPPRRRYTMAVRTNTNGIAAAIAQISDDAWQEIDYTPDGQAQVAECAYTTGSGGDGDPPTDRASHPTHRSRPTAAVARLASPRLVD